MPYFINHAVSKQKRGPKVVAAAEIGLSEKRQFIMCVILILFISLLLQVCNQHELVFIVVISFFETAHDTKEYTLDI